MIPSESTIAEFLAFAPEADEGKAFVFLEGSESIQAAVESFYADPDKYSNAQIADAKTSGEKPIDKKIDGNNDVLPPAYTLPAGYVPSHTNPVIHAALVRARDEQEMQTLLQQVQINNRIYNSDIEPEHEVDIYCNCDIHQYQRRKWTRLGVQNLWSSAVMYPGEKAYSDCDRSVFASNPYMYIPSPFSRQYTGMFGPRISPQMYATSIHSTISLNARLNAEAQNAVNSREPKHSIWDGGAALESAMAELTLAQERQKRSGSGKPSKLAGLKRALSIRTPEEKELQRLANEKTHAAELRTAILREEEGRWPDPTWRHIVVAYQEKVGMRQKISGLRLNQPIQYLHLLRAGYFEPIPVAWANLVSNPLKFSIEAASGWRGITPAWRGYEDTAEERLYWVLNHREGSAAARMKPDLISALDMARRRMASAVEPPPAYFSADDTCHLQHTSDGYSKQVMPPPFRAYDAPEVASDDTMILLDVSGSMDFTPMRPNYDGYLITGYSRSTQPKNKDVAKAIVRRFTDAMINHDRNRGGYELVTFSSHATPMGYIHHTNLETQWNNIRFGGGTRVMTGWQMVKELHFQKHAQSATHHPVYGWQAGPKTPMLRLLLLLDGEATDMDEFELDLLSLSWVHVTIFLIGVDGCPHHHRHANELQRISEVNHHVSFVDAQGNTPERFVTHELLKRHLGYDVSMAEFERLELPPAYEE
ncbi:hypothetical protein ASPZODRAFT_19311 [Penicilliopsis zonata CBS 506.65]|uniref:VWFA domain-containing protein n=1 Tax=Penicilliopsis zonata CBS 506.65 TaxID=1073090 RepID=A0A1L9S8Y7_9EURO|nr:hypothetical protein ASPZODRAFT_19311 [Penicilliopsis zonata CBS 506.65]OJJ43589.1 hypothetical protein ASPZODRAFT_19311 [Penicilliopsis zonata CBS 506.65]